jgi:hypothetical protein
MQKRFSDVLTVSSFSSCPAYTPALSLLPQINNQPTHHDDNDTLFAAPWHQSTQGERSAPPVSRRFIAKRTSRALSGALWKREQSAFESCAARDPWRCCTDAGWTYIISSEGEVRERKGLVGCGGILKRGLYGHGIVWSTLDKVRDELSLGFRLTSGQEGMCLTES